MWVFFREGGWGMYPVSVIGIVLLWSGIRYAIDREPARRTFIHALSFAYLACIAQSLLTNLATVFWAISDRSRVSDADRPIILLVGLKESTRPAILGLSLLGLALLAVAIGVYRNGLRELRATRG